MANERTFNSWVRTGLTAVVGGLFVARFIGEGQKSFLVTVIGLVFILSSMGFYAVGYWRFRKDMERIKGKEIKRGVSHWVILSTSLALIFSAALSLLLIYQLYSMN
ncbi:MAG: DUF202 domain-containing protein [Methanobacterium sp.]|nr:DUF202 domain-containing protein [Methanobacterium sp.]